MKLLLMIAFFVTAIEIVHAQPTPVRKTIDNPMLRSIGSIGWSFDLTCWPKKINDTPATTQTWTGSISVTSFDSVSPNDGLSIKGNTYTIVSGFWPMFGNGSSVSITIDTIQKTLSVSYGQLNWSASCSSSFGASLNYEISDSAMNASSTIVSPDYGCVSGHNCNSCNHCSVTIGRGLMLQSMEAQEPAMSNFGIVNTINSIHFLLPVFNNSFIRIFDLLGRECDRVAIPAGAESVEYNTSRLAPGLYIATLGQQAVKFVVR